MAQAKDLRQVDLLGGAIRQRGRPASLDGAATGAERQAARRRRLKEEGKGVLTVELSLEVIEALDKFVQFKDETKGGVVDRVLRDRLMRKR
jgi:hypothetical protein